MQTLHKYFKYLFLLLILPLYGFTQNSGETIVDLNGQWDFIPSGLGKTKIQVPGCYVWDTLGKTFPVTGSEPYKLIEGIPEAAYEKTFQVPSDMSGKRIFLHFEAVNFVCDVYLNSTLIASNDIGFVPFEIDITDIVRMSSTNKLRVEIKYYTSRFMDANNNYITPIAYYGAFWNLGITGDVSLIARSNVYIEDTWVQTSVKNHTITSQTKVINRGSTTQKFYLVSCVEENVLQILTMGVEWVQLAAGKDTTITLTNDWPNPTLWTPSHPYLYQHTAVLMNENMSSTLFLKKHTFGFREFWAEGTNFYLNDHPIHLRGDNVVIFGERDLTAYLSPTRQALASIVDSLKALHFNIIRIGDGPLPPWMLDVCDEKGMLLISTSGVRSPNVTFGSPTFHSNADQLIGKWVRRDRNHPSLIIYEIENEAVTINPKIYYGSQVAQWAVTAETLDPTRLTIFEGDLNLSNSVGYHASIYSSHYYLIGGIGAWPYISPWPATRIDNYLKSYVSANIPTSWGEFEFIQGNGRPRLDDKQWHRRQCVLTRAGRMLDVDDLRPYRLDWAWHPNQGYYDYFYAGKKPDASDILFLKNTMNPCAVFDKDYYATALFPTPATYNEGSQVNRSVLVFNEDEGATIQLRWETRYQGKTENTYSQILEIPTGTKLETTISFKTPYVPDLGDFTCRLSTWKNNRQLYTEDYTFRAKDIGLNPPLEIKNFGIEPWENHIRLSWDRGVPTAEGSIDNTYQFYIYKSGNPEFSEAGTIVIGPVTDSLYIDASFSRSEDSLSCWFYRLIARNGSGKETKPTDGIGAINTAFVSPVNSTRINVMGLPFQMTSNVLASELIDSIPYCQSIAIWNTSTQNYTQFHPDIPPTDFNVNAGQVLYVYAPHDTVFTKIGTYQPLSYSLLHNEDPNKTSWNDLILPPDRFTLQSASDLLADIPGADAVARWNSSTQGFDQFVSGLSENNFTIHPGQPYKIHMESNTVWPDGGAPAKANKQLSGDQNLIPLPHIVYGSMSSSDAIVDFKASLTSKPEEILNSGSPGCKISSDHWIVQCASFESPWQVGDTLAVRFLGQDGGTLDTRFVRLSNHPADQLEYSDVPASLSKPDRFFLNPCYPNPFNAHCVISYELPEASHVAIHVFDAAGRKITTLFNGVRQPGFYQETWNGSNGYKGDLPSGLYIIRLETDKQQFNRKVVLLK